MPELIVNMRPLLCPSDNRKYDNRANQSQAYQFFINLIKQIIKCGEIQLQTNNDTKSDGI